MNRAAGSALALAATLAFATPAAATIPVYLLGWGTIGGGPGEFDNLAGIAAPGNGSVYVLDSDQARVLEFTNQGAYVTQWYVGSPLPAFPPEGVIGIGVDRQGRLYLSQHHIHRILRYSAGGTLDFIFGGNGHEPGLFHYPNDVKVDRQDRLWVVDQFNHRVQRLDHDGKFQLMIGETDVQGSEPGKFRYPFGIAFDSQNDVYVTDHNNNRVQKFTAEGEFITQWGMMGTGPGQFDRPTGIAVDPLDNVYVVDTFNDRVQMFSPTGAYLGEFGGTGTKPGFFQFPVCIAIDDLGFLYIGDENNHRVQKFGTKVTPVAKSTLGQLKARFR